MNFAKPVHESFAHSTPEPLPFRKAKWAIPYSAISPIAMTCDALVIFLASIGGGVVYHQYALGDPGNIQQFGGMAAIVGALFISLGKSNGLYKASDLLSLRSQIHRVTIKWIGIFLFLSAIAFTMKVGSTFSRGATLTFAVAGLTGLIGMRAIWRIFLTDRSAIRQFSGRRVVLVTEQSSTIESILPTTFAHQGLRLAKHFVLPAGRNDTQGRKNVIRNVVSIVRGSDIEEIIVTTSLDHWSELDKLLATLKVLPCPVTLIPVGPISNLFRLPIHTIGNTVTIEFQRGPLSVFARFLKRTVDIVISGTAIILLLPLFLMTTIAIKLDSPGPAIFRQRRCGFNGRQFHILKFRSMSVLEDDERIEHAKRNDCRVTCIGRWLRQTSIDELPQLFNVLQGSMSIVGPRPHALAHDNQFDKMVRKYAYRHHVKPGITGWAQVNGHRGSMATVTDVEHRVERDLWYIDNWSLALDFKIILMTAIKIIRDENAY